MKIAVCGSSCVGKTTFINDFLKQWPMYIAPKRSYRQAAKASDIKLNRDGDLVGQKAIQEILYNQIEETKNEKYVIYDRGPLDNLVYSIWLNAKKKGDVDDLYIEQAIAKFKKIVSVYDIIFFIPILDAYPIEIVPDEQRDTNPEFRGEIDNLFKGIIQTYHKGKDTFFPKDDCPAIIEIFGTPEQRLEMAKLYINSKGDIFGEEDNLMNDVEISEEDVQALKDLVEEKKLSVKKIPQIII
jgi:hypothetical protein